jgi:GxxExxY protein
LCLGGRKRKYNIPQSTQSHTKKTLGDLCALVGEKIIIMTENELAKIAVDICYKVHTQLGPGLLESVYEAAVCYELDKLNLKYTRQQGINAAYDGIVLDVGFRADIIVEEKVILELKSVEALTKVHHKTVLTYLKLSNIKLALLINFNVELIKDGINRKIMGQLL